MYEGPPASQKPRRFLQDRLRQALRRPSIQGRSPDFSERVLTTLTVRKRPAPPSGSPTHRRHGRPPGVCAGVANPKWTPQHAFSVPEGHHRAAGALKRGTRGLQSFSWLTGTAPGAGATAVPPRTQRGVTESAAGRPPFPTKTRERGGDHRASDTSEAESGGREYELGNKNRQTSSRDGRRLELPPMELRAQECRRGPSGPGPFRASPVHADGFLCTERIDLVRSHKKRHSSHRPLSRYAALLGQAFGQRCRRTRSCGPRRPLWPLGTSRAGARA